ncbi:sensor histidine kinase KdpD [Seleniivibrio woodruffii]|uniref:sensor histidine kinase n=1 Tax=Seleniivibrio woodruffii TaxID=1078050 RepID=UPI0026EB6BBE|nr:HAMP domain-containing sensor histidine kinase [Seleniivibrio woodruffii]
MLHTNFAPAERDNNDTILEVYRHIASEPIFKALMDRLEQNILILNDKRQTVFANNSVLKNYSIEKPEDILGLRPGEIFRCINSTGEGGCGTALFCKECAAVNSILATQLIGDERIDECMITSVDGETFELQISSKPFEFRGTNYTLFSLCDIGQKKRMKVLEQVFFHDILNIAGGIHSMLRLIMDDSVFDDNDQKEKLNRLLVATSEQLINELSAHKTLKAAEMHELIVSGTRFMTTDFLSSVVSVAENMKCAYGKIIYLDSSSDNFELESDESLLSRVIMNMLTNALEASEIGDKVTLSVKLLDSSAVFSVHNKQVIPQQHRHRIFSKSFTTKKHGSGLGTHSIKLLTERYLKGRADFSTGKDTGTVFIIRLPMFI